MPSYLKKKRMLTGSASLSSHILISQSEVPMYIESSDLMINGTFFHEFGIP